MNCELELLRVIRRKCKDCCCGDLKEVDNCVITDCPLYKYRKGRSK